MVPEQLTSKILNLLSNNLQHLLRYHVPFTLPLPILLPLQPFLSLCPPLFPPPLPLTLPNQPLPSLDTCLHVIFWHHLNYFSFDVMRNINIMLLCLLFLSLTLTSQQCTNSSQAYIHPQFKQPYGSITTQLTQAFRMYINKQGNLTNVVMQLKPYVIPIIVLLVLQITLILAVTAWKIYRCRRKQQEGKEYGRGTTITLMVIAGVTATAILSLAILVTLSSISTEKYNDDAQCRVGEAVGNFLKGETDKWIGVENVAEQANQASLSFNNNIRQMKVGLLGLIKNGSGLGTPITPFTTIEAYVNNALINRALILNTSVNSKQFPVCQTSIIALPSPVTAGQKVNLTYPQKICSDLKAQSQALVSQARSLDQMNSHLTNLIGNRTNIVNNVTALASSYSNYVNSSNFTNIKTSIDPSSGKTLSYVLTALLALLAIGYLIILVARSQTLIKIYPIVYVLAPIVSIMAAVQSIYYLTAGASVHASCSLFDQAKTDATLYSNLTSSYGSTLDPLYFCLTNPTATFLNSSSMQDSLTSVANLTLLQTHHKNAIPASVLQSKSIAYTDQIGNYLADLSTIPINGTITVADALIKLNQIGDYTYNGSTQSPLCNISRDQFVFAPKKCTRPLLDPTNSTEVTSSSPFCIQLPINNRTYNLSNLSSFASTSLNQMQHLYTNSSTECSTIAAYFDASKNCFVKQRATALFASCPSVMSDYMAMLNRTVSFSYLAGQYTDSYMQNLRNYLGIYLTVSSNISAFYLSYNISEMVSSISNNVSNISNLSSCQYAYQSMNTVKEQFCGELAPSFFMTPLFGLLSVGLVFGMTVVVVLVEPRLQLFIGVKVTSDQKMRVDSEIDLNQDRLHEHRLHEQTIEPLGIRRNREENHKEDSGWEDVRMEEHKVLEESEKHSGKMSEKKSEGRSQRSGRENERLEDRKIEKIEKINNEIEKKSENNKPNDKQQQKSQHSNSQDELQPIQQQTPIQTIIDQKMSRAQSAKNNVPQQHSSKSSRVKKPQSQRGQHLDMIYQFEQPPLPVADSSNSHLLQDPITQIKFYKPQQPTIPTEEDYERQFKKTQFARKPRNIILGISMKSVFGRQQQDSPAMSIQDLKIEGSDDENMKTVKKPRQDKD